MSQVVTNGAKAAYTVVIWFRNDLRLRDNAVLQHPELKKATHLLGVYCFDDRFENRFTRRFREQALGELQQDFSNTFGAPLQCFQGKPENIIPQIVQSLSNTSGGSVLASEEVTSYEKGIDEKLQASLSPLGFSLRLVWNYSLYHPDDLPFDVRAGELPEPYTSFRKRIEDNNVQVRPLLEVPQLPKLPCPEFKGQGVRLESLPNIFTPRDNGEARDISPHGFESKTSGTESHCLTFRGGESAALQRLEYFIEHGLAEYKTKRNGSVGWDYSSKMSPWLAAGCISPRQIYHRIQKFENKYGESVHTYWCAVFEQLWRDFLRFHAMKYGNKIFFELGPSGEMPKGATWSYGDRDTVRKFEAWKEGRTGIPWVDGHMREIVRTGFMSNRGRQNVASFLIHNLQVDWRKGAKFFEDTLIDHDVTSNYGNWLAVAGVASRGSRLNRFNMDKQARDYDKLAEHARLWIPELSSVRPEAIHDLALRGNNSGMDKYRKSVALADAEKAKVNYPTPIVRLPQHDPSKRHSRTKRAHKGKNNVFYTT